MRDYHATFQLFPIHVYQTFYNSSIQCKFTCTEFNGQ